MNFFSETNASSEVIGIDLTKPEGEREDEDEESPSVHGPRAFEPPMAHHNIGPALSPFPAEVETLELAAKDWLTHPQNYYYSKPISRTLTLPHKSTSPEDHSVVASCTDLIKCGLSNRDQTLPNRGRNWGWVR